VIGQDDCLTLCPHNVVLTKEWMIMMPRRTNDYEGANACGMMGLPMMSSQETQQKWIDVGSAKILSELGVLVDAAEPAS
jgi:ATP adenylyltransferase